MQTNSQLAMDVCANKHKGAIQSELAFDRVAPYLTKQRSQVLQWLFIKGDQGGTVKECERELGMGYTSASARLSELVRDGYVTDTDEVREHCTVRRAVVIG